MTIAASIALIKNYPHRSTMLSGDDTWHGAMEHLFESLNALDFTLGTFKLGTEDVLAGAITLYGQAANQGGSLTLDTPGDGDTVIDSYVIQSYDDDLLIGPVTNTDALLLKNDYDLYLTDGDMQIQKTGTTNVLLDATNATIAVGVADTTPGIVKAFGHANTQGGKLTLETPGDGDTTINSWDMQAYNDDLYLGPVTDTDLITVTNDKDFYLTDGDMYIQGAGTTYIKLYATGASIMVGADDVVYGGVLAYGQATGSAEGGEFRAYCAADHDAAINYFQFKAYEDDLLIGPNTDTDALKLTSDKDLCVTAGSIVIETASEYINMGAVTLGDAGYGIHDNAGVMQTKDSGGTWRNIDRFISLYQQWIDLAAPTTTGMITQKDLTGKAQEHCPLACTIAAHPIHGRNLVVTGTQLTGATEVVVRVTGTNHLGVDHYEDFTVNTGAKVATGNKPFFGLVTVNITTITGTGGAGDLLDIGMGSKMGLLGEPVTVVKECKDGAIDTPGTLNTTYYTNTFDHAPDGVHDYELIYSVRV